MIKYRWSCSFAYDCSHRWRWTAVLHQRWRRLRRTWAKEWLG